MTIAGIIARIVYAFYNSYIFKLGYIVITRSNYIRESREIWLPVIADHNKIRLHSFVFIRTPFWEESPFLFSSLQKWGQYT